MELKQIYDYGSFPELESERLLLRELILSDAADLLEFRGDAYVQRFNMEPLKTIEEAKVEIRRTHAAFAEKDSLGWAVVLRKEQKVVGGVGLYSWSRRHRKAEVGYDLNRAYWGRGIAGEALHTVLNFAFSQMNLNRIYAGTIADNHESVRLLARNGFTHEGTRRQSSWEDDGTFHDSALYGLLRHEFYAAVKKLSRLPAEDNEGERNGR